MQGKKSFGFDMDSLVTIKQKTIFSAILILFGLLIARYTDKLFAYKNVYVWRNCYV